MRAKKAHQSVEAAARVATEMALEMHAHTNARLRISAFVADTLLMLKR
jgi:hypothetical protein